MNATFNTTAAGPHKVALKGADRTIVTIAFAAQFAASIIWYVVWAVGVNDLLNATSFAGKVGVAIVAYISGFGLRCIFKPNVTGIRVVLCLLPLLVVWAATDNTAVLYSTIAVGVIYTISGASRKPVADR